MKNNRLMRIAVFCALIAAASPVSAEGSAKTFLKLIDDGDKMTMYVLDGFANGLGWANSHLQNQGQDRLYCEPEKLAMSPEQTVRILRDYVRENPENADLPAGLVLLLAMQDVFPCKSGGHTRRVEPSEREGNE